MSENYLKEHWHLILERRSEIMALCTTNARRDGFVNNQDFALLTVVPCVEVVGDVASALVVIGRPQQARTLLAAAIARLQEIHAKL